MTHTQHEDFPWTIAIVDHAPRKETSEYRASRALMRKIVDQVPDWVLAPGPYEDHHGGSIWVKDETGWLLVQQAIGIEWSAQFCADPAKIDALRRTAARIVAAFPLTIPSYEELDYTAARDLLDTEIVTAEHVSHWTDSIFNASMPIPRAAHTGVYPHGAGYHHYPKPIVDIVHFCRDDFNVFVDDDGLPAVVVPTSADPSDGVRLLAAHPGAPHARMLLQEEAARVRRGEADNLESLDDETLPAGQRLIDDESAENLTLLPADDNLAQQAFGRVPRP